jgi:hypothetical protein
MCCRCFCPSLPIAGHTPGRGRGGDRVAELVVVTLLTHLTRFPLSTLNYREAGTGGGVKGCWPELAAEDFAPRMSGRVCSRCCSRCGVVVEFYTYVFGIQTSLHLQPKHTYVVAYFRAHFAACIDDWLDERAVLSAGDAITSSTIPTCVWLNW